MAMISKSGISEQTVTSCYTKNKNKSLSNRQPKTAVISFFIAIILSVGLLAGCGGSGSSGDGDEPLNGIDSTESLNLDTMKSNVAEWG